MEESNLVFIISQPRAGSTLLQKLVSNNERVDTVSEPWMLLPLFSILKPSLVKAEYNYTAAHKGFTDYLRKKDAEAEFKQQLKSLALSMYKVKDDNLFVDKTPRYYEIIPEIIGMFPRARVIFLKRNPFASLHSMMKTWSYGKIDFEAMNRFYRDFLVAPFLIQKGVEEFRSNPNVKEVVYEEIVADPAGKVRDLYQWLGLTYTDTVLEIGENEKVKGIFGDDVYKSQPLKEIKPELTDAWKSVNSDKELARFFSGYQEFLTPAFLKKYGYAPENFVAGGFSLGKDKFQEYISLLKKNGQL